MPSDYFERSLSVVERPANTIDEENGFWRMRRPDFGEHGGLIRGGMFDHQSAWWNLPNFVKLLVGGYGSGKTAVCGKRAIALALQNAPCAGAVVSPTYNMARQTTIAALADYCAGKRSIYGREFAWQYNQSSHEFRIFFRGRSAKIIIYSGDNPLSLRGPNLAWALIDEPFIQDQEVFDQMVARVRHPDAKHREIGLTGTPEQLNWGYDLVEGELGEKHDVGIIQASTRANLALDPSYVDRLMASYSDKAALAYIEGQFVNLSTGLVYYAFDPSEHMVEAEIPTGAELGVGMDFNVDPMAAIVFWRQGSRMHVIEEIELENADTEYMCSVLREKYWDKGLRNVYPDASGRSRRTAAPGAKSDFYYISQAGFEIFCHGSNPARKDRYNAVNGKLKPRAGKLSLTFSPSCKKLKKGMSTYAHELMNKASHKAMSHLLDALGYPIAYLFPVDHDTFRIKPLRGA